MTLFGLIGVVLHIIAEMMLRKEFFILLKPHAIVEPIDFIILSK